MITKSDVTRDSFYMEIIEGKDDRTMSEEWIDIFHLQFQW